MSFLALLMSFDFWGFNFRHETRKEHQKRFDYARKYNKTLNLGIKNGVLKRYYGVIVSLKI